ncbi:RteC domain-containing protein [Mucilaginibacter sp. UYCu711]|uniref:RteC domain-containing protein n=1 Tax=Mucilaginibacter sp. UYCu711 TaxID=3156339 RepID=UPI003D20FEB9
MKTFTERFLSALENQLTEISLNNQPLPGQFKASVLVSKKAMTKLKNYVASYAFDTVAEEVHFFKEVKPKFYSRYIYFISLYNFAMQKPSGGEDIQRDYIRMHLSELKTFFDHNRAFYAYYRSGMKQLDELYFTRGGFDVHIELEDFEEDEQFSTSHDYKLSKLIANEKFQDYLNLELAKIGNEDLANLNGHKVFPFTHPSWTASPTDAIELIYSLKASGSVNNGNVDVSELVGIFEFVFQMEIKESYHKLLDISKRKKVTPLFLNKLKDGLIRLIEDKLGL